MADLYANFAYCTLTAGAAATDTVLQVDSTSRIPDPSLGEVWLCFDSTLALGAFEIVKVTAKTASTLTVVRAQEGTSSASAVATGTVLRGTLTAAMLTRLRNAIGSGGGGGTSLLSAFKGAYVPGPYSAGDVVTYLGSTWMAKQEISNTAVAYQDAVLADAPYLYYRLGDAVNATTVLDSSGNGLTGTPTSVTFGTTGLTPDANTAAGYNGSSSYIIAPSAAYDTSSLTVEAAIKTTTAGRMIVRRDYNEGPRVFGFGIDASGVVNFFIISGGNALVVAGATNVCDNVARHVAATYDGTTARIYVDGVLDGSGALNAALPQPGNTPLEIGVHYFYGTPYQPFQGTLDEVAYYKTVLSASRLLVHSQARKGLASGAFFAPSQWHLLAGPPLSLATTERLATSTVTTADWTTTGSGSLSGGVGTATNSGSQQGAIIGKSTFALVDGLVLKADIQGGGGSGSSGVADGWQFGLADASVATTFINSPNGLYLDAVTYQTYTWGVTARTGGTALAHPNPATLNQLGVTYGGRIYDPYIYKQMQLELLFEQHRRTGQWKITVFKDDVVAFITRMTYAAPSAGVRVFLASYTGGVSGTVTIANPSVYTPA